MEAPPGGDDFGSHSEPRAPGTVDGSGVPGGGGGGGYSDPSGIPPPPPPPGPGGEGRPPGAGREDLPFARALAVVGVTILVLSALLLSLPSYLEGGPGVYLIAYGIAILFGPVGFWLLGEAWRIRNRALHGTTLPPGQRRGLRILGVALIAIGVFVAFSGFGASGTISTVLNLVWGLTLAGYGVRSLLRSLSSERA